MFNCNAVFAFFCYLYFPVVFCLYPETSQRTLEDMDQIFIQNPSPFVFGKPDMTQRKRPQAFIDAESERIAEAANTELGKDIIDAKAHVRSHVEDA
jgi:hypothetical protein